MLFHSRWYHGPVWSSGSLFPKFHIHILSSIMGTSLFTQRDKNLPALSFMESLIRRVDTKTAVSPRMVSGLVVAIVKNSIFAVILYLYNAFWFLTVFHLFVRNSGFGNRVPVYHTHTPVYFTLVIEVNEYLMTLSDMSSSMVNLSSSHMRPQFLKLLQDYAPVLLPPFQHALRNSRGLDILFFNSFTPEFCHYPCLGLQWKHDRCPVPERIFTCHAGTPGWADPVWYCSAYAPCAAPPWHWAAESQSYRVYGHQALTGRILCLTNIDTIYPLPVSDRILLQFPWIRIYLGNRALKFGKNRIYWKQDGGKWKVEWWKRWNSGTVEQWNSGTVKQWTNWTSHFKFSKIQTCLPASSPP